MVERADELLSLLASASTQRREPKLNPPFEVLALKSMSSDSNSLCNISVKERDILTVTEWIPTETGEVWKVNTETHGFIPNMDNFLCIPVNEFVDSILKKMDKSSTVSAQKVDPIIVKTSLS